MVRDKNSTKNLEQYEDHYIEPISLNSKISEDSDIEYIEIIEGNCKSIEYEIMLGSVYDVGRKILSDRDFDIFYNHYHKGINNVDLAKKYNITNSYVGLILVTSLKYIKEFYSNFNVDILYKDKIDLDKVANKVLTSKEYTIFYSFYYEKKSIDRLAKEYSKTTRKIFSIISNSVRKINKYYRIGGVI